MVQGSPRNAIASANSLSSGAARNIVIEWRHNLICR